MHGSQIFSCLLDVSKAFDRIHYGKLFNMLVDRNLPAFSIRVLFDSYSRQQSRAMWNSCYIYYLFHTQSTHIDKSYINSNT